MSGATGVAAMALLVTLTRGLGQSALSVISLALVGSGSCAASTGDGALQGRAERRFHGGFPSVGATVHAEAGARRGPALAWRWCRDSRRSAGSSCGAPEACGLPPDGESRPRRQRARADQLRAFTPGRRWRRRPSGSSLSSSAVYGLVASGIGLFNESILAERGFGAGDVPPQPGRSSR